MDVYQNQVYRALMPWSYAKQVYSTIYNNQSFRAYYSLEESSFTNIRLSADINNDFFVTGSKLKNYQVFRIFPENYEKSVEKYLSKCMTISLAGDNPEEDPRAQTLSFDDKLIRLQWYPVDRGIFAALSSRQLDLIATEKQELFYSFKKSFFCSMDWNRLEPRLIALTSRIDKNANKREMHESYPMMVFDLRIGGCSLHLSSLQQPSLWGVCYWSPLDVNGLFYGHSDGSISFYDLRILKKSLAHHIPTNQEYKYSIQHLSMTPNHRNLITIHPNAPTNVAVWRIEPKKRENDCFLTSVPIRMPLGDPRTRLKLEKHIYLTPFVTDTYVLMANTRWSSRSNHRMFIYHAFNDVKPNHSNQNSKENSHPIWMNTENAPQANGGYHIMGYRRTAHGDEPLPALVTSFNGQLSVQRLRHREYNQTDLVSHRFDYGQEDRWSSDDND